MNCNWDVTLVATCIKIQIMLNLRAIKLNKNRIKEFKINFRCFVIFEHKPVNNNKVNCNTI